MAGVAAAFLAALDALAGVGVGWGAAGAGAGVGAVVSSSAAALRALRRLRRSSAGSGRLVVGAVSCGV